MAKFTDRYKAKGQKAVTTGTGGTVKSGTGTTVTSRSFREAPSAAPKAVRRGTPTKASKAPVTGSPSLSVGPPTRGGKRRKPSGPSAMSKAPTQPQHRPAFSITYPESTSDKSPVSKRPAGPNRPPVGMAVKAQKHSDSRNLGQVAEDLGRILGLSQPRKSKRPKARK